MSDEWVDKGVTGSSVAGDIAETIASGGLSAALHGATGGDTRVEEHRVENKETGETRKVAVGGNQTVGEAIAEGQWMD